MKSHLRNRFISSNCSNLPSNTAQKAAKHEEKGPFMRETSTLSPTSVEFKLSRFGRESAELARKMSHSIGFSALLLRDMSCFYVLLSYELRHVGRDKQRLAVFLQIFGVDQVSLVYDMWELGTKNIKRFMRLVPGRFDFYRLEFGSARQQKIDFIVMVVVLWPCVIKQLIAFIWFTKMF